MAISHPGKISGETSAYSSCEGLSLAARSALYIQGDMYLVEKRDGCSQSQENGKAEAAAPENPPLHESSLTGHTPPLVTDTLPRLI